jgi:hypothetical protein
MKTALAIGLGAVGGFALAMWLKPASKEYCCRKVAEGAKEKVESACGPLGFLCGGVWDALGLGEQAPSILEAIGF